MFLAVKAAGKTATECYRDETGAIVKAGGAGAINIINIHDVYHRGAVTIVGSPNNYTGGLVGYSDYLNLVNGYNTGSVAGKTDAGGIIGAAISSTINHTFSTATVTGNASEVGPIFGTEIAPASAGVNYFDTNLSGFSTDSVDANSVAIGTSSYFYSDSSAVFTGWSFPSVWHQNWQDYPTLTPMTPPSSTCSSVDTTTTTIHVTCSVNPTGWGITLWQMRYQKLGDTAWTNIALTDTHTADTLLQGLQSGTTYAVEAQFTDDYGTSAWQTTTFSTLTPMTLSGIQLPSALSYITDASIPEPTATDNSPTPSSSMPELAAVTNQRPSQSSTPSNPTSTSANSNFSWWELSIVIVVVTVGLRYFLKYAQIRS